MMNRTMHEQHQLAKFLSNVKLMASTMTMNNRINLQKCRNKISAKFTTLIINANNTKQALVMDTNNA